MVVHGLCGRVTDSARNACSLNCCCLVGGAGDLQEGYFALPDANFLSSWCQFPFSRAQNRGFCAFLASETPVFGHFEHKIGVFVLFRASEPPFSGISSTKSRFLCFFALRNPRFQAFRAQNRHFCARADGDTASVRVHWRVSIRNRGDDHRLRAFRAQNRAALPTGSLFPMVCTGTGEEIRPHMWRQ